MRTNNRKIERMKNRKMRTKNRKTERMKSRKTEILKYVD